MMGKLYEQVILKRITRKCYLFIRLGVRVKGSLVGRYISEIPD